MSELAHPADTVTGPLRPARGLSLLGEHQESESAEPEFLVRRGDARVVKLSRLLYLVAVAIAEAAVDGNGRANPELVAARVSREWGREVTAADVRQLVATDLAPLGVVIVGAPGQTSAQAVAPAIDEAPTTPLQAVPPTPAASPQPPQLSPQLPAVSPPTLQPSPLAPAVTPQATHASPRRRPRRALVVGALVVVVAAAVATVAVTVKKPGPPAASAADSEARAAAWVAQQVSPGTAVACDAATCAQVQRNGFPAARLMTLVPATPDPLGAAVVIATAAVRREFGTRLDTEYAPLVIASFGSGADRVEVRATAPDGAATLTAELNRQRASLRSAGQQLLRNRTVQATPAARADLLAGRVDPRLLANLSVLSSQSPITVVAFDDAPPGASPAVPLPGVRLSAASAAGRSAILAFLQAQQGTYRPAAAAMARDAGGQPVVTARFDAPDPLSAP